MPWVRGVRGKPCLCLPSLPSALNQVLTFAGQGFPVNPWGGAVYPGTRPMGRGGLLSGSLLAGAFKFSAVAANFFRRETVRKKFATTSV